MGSENWLRIRIDASKYHDIMQAGVDRLKTPEYLQHFTPENMKIDIQWLPPTVFNSDEAKTIKRVAVFEKRVRLNGKLYFDFIVNTDPAQLKRDLDRSDQTLQQHIEYLCGLAN